MSEDSNQDKKRDFTYGQSVPWYQTDMIIANISTFLGPTDLCSFRLVCKKWKDESCAIWMYYRTRHILRRYSKFGLKTSLALHDRTFPKVDLEPLTVFSEYRPPEMECIFDCVWAEELRYFFSNAKNDDANLKETAFLVIKLKKWNRFGAFRAGEQTGAKWFLNEIADKVLHLTLDRCNLSISQGEFFSTLCRMIELKELIIKGSCFQLRPSYQVEPTMAEITPLSKLKVVEMNYENCSVKRMPNYYFPWNLFLGAATNLKVLMFSFSNIKNLNFAIHQFSIMIMVPNSVRGKIFRNLSEPTEGSFISKTKVIKMVQESLNKLDIGSSTLHNVQGNLPAHLPVSSDFKLHSLFALVNKRLIGIKFQDYEDDLEIRDIGLTMELFLELHEIHYEN